MNIFVLDSDIINSVQCYVDSHVIKMQVETAQLLSTASYLGNPTLHTDWKWYKPTHINHPCNIWARESLDNYNYLVDLMDKLGDEWRYRWEHNRIHSSFEKLQDMPPPINFPSNGITKFAICTGLDVIDNDVVECYRKYYAFNKTHLHKWKRRGPPVWLKDYV